MPDAEIAVDDIQGDCLELKTRIVPAGAREIGIRIRRSPDVSEQTGIVFDAVAQKLRIDVSRSTLDRDMRYPYYCNQAALARLPDEEHFVTAQEAPFEPAADEAIDLHIFLDRSIVEVFANNRQCITQRIYPIQPESTGVALFSRGRLAAVPSLHAWHLAPSHD